MWYFTWILGLGLACAFAILNALWFELVTGEADDEPGGGETPEENHSGQQLAPARRRQPRLQGRALPE